MKVYVCYVYGVIHFDDRDDTVYDAVIKVVDTVEKAKEWIADTAGVRPYREQRDYKEIDIE